MVTQKPRINMVLDPEDYGELEALAKREGKSLSETARSLVLEMLEIVEDVTLASLAAERRRSFSPESALSHEEVWGSKGEPSLTKKGKHELRRLVPPRRRKARSAQNPG